MADCCGGGLGSGLVVLFLTGRCSTLIPDTPSSTTLGAPATNDKGAAAKEPEEEWITFDDSNSCKTTLDKIQASKFKSQTAYMLLYSLDE